MVWPIFNRANVPCSMLAHLRGRKLWRRFLLLPLAELVTSHLQDGAQTLHLPENFLVYLPLVVKPLISNLVSAIARNLRKFPSAALSKTVISKGGSLSALRGFTANTALFVNQLSLLMKNSCRVWFFICSFRHFFCSRAPGGRGRARSCIPRSSEGFTVRYISVMQEVSSPRSWHFNNSEHF